ALGPSQGYVARKAFARVIEVNRVPAEITPCSAPSLPIEDPRWCIGVGWIVKRAPSSFPISELLEDQNGLGMHLVGSRIARKYGTGNAWSCQTARKAKCQPLIGDADPVAGIILVLNPQPTLYQIPRISSYS